MRLNAFLWNTFTESQRGKEWVDFFSHLGDRYGQQEEKLRPFLLNWASQGTLNKNQNDIEKDIAGVILAVKELQQAARDGLIPAKIESQKDADFYFHEVGDLAPDEDEEECLFKVDDISWLSVALHILHPKFFFPYYFYPNFHALKTIFDEFGIFLPPVPPKSDYDGRFFYYLELCRSLNEYWSALNLKPEHIPAFLYGFAPEVLDLKFPQIIELPEPHRAWFVGGGINNNGDFNFLDKIDASSLTFWQGNKETEEGDIIVMYCLAPRSCIHSIWRAIRPGGVEPFRDYYSTIWMGYPQLVESLPYSEIKIDPILSKMPLVKGNMQGINGRQIPKEFYDRILFLLREKGTKVESLPQLKDKEVKGLRLKNERDVEAHLLEPLLEELGFKPTDWERQVKLRVGRSEKVIPDYLIHVSKDKSAKTISADWVWEAKFSISSHEQLQKDFGQVCSYARLVSAKGVGLISKEGAWISSKKEDFSVKNAKHWSAKQIREIDSLSEIRAIAGKRRISG